MPFINRHSCSFGHFAFFVGKGEASALASVNAEAAYICTVSAMTIIFML
jgi:hypothetical protein